MTRKGTKSALTVTAMQAMAIGEERGVGDRLTCVKLDGNRFKWVLRYVSPANNARRETTRTGIGLKSAREWADGLRREIDAGRDPLESKAAEAERQRRDAAGRLRDTTRASATLGTVASELHRDLSPKFRNRKHSKQWLASIETHASDLWSKPCCEITIANALDTLLPVYRAHRETGARVRQRCEAAQDRAVLRGWADSNPFAAIKRELGTLVPRPKSEGFRAPGYADVAQFLADIRASDRIGLAVKLAVQFTVATAARSGESRGGTWREVDLKARKWTLEPDRTKNGVRHVVHLNDYALRVLREAEALRDPKRGDDAPLFPAPRSDGALSDMSLTMAIRRAEWGEAATMHGIARACFSSWANEAARARPDVIERCLNHVETNAVRAAYLRADFEVERAKLLDRWGRFIATTQPAAKVVPLRSA